MSYVYAAHDRADGVKGHYAIGRRPRDGKYWEFWNKGEWKGVAEVFVGCTKAWRAFAAAVKKDFSNEQA